MFSALIRLLTASGLARPLFPKKVYSEGSSPKDTKPRENSSSPLGQALSGCGDGPSPICSDLGAQPRADLLRKEAKPRHFGWEQSRGDLHQCWMESCPLAVQLCKGKCAVQLPKEKRSICWDTRKDFRDEVTL